jgi:hypothetical protein
MTKQMSRHASWRTTAAALALRLCLIASLLALALGPALLSTPPVAQAAETLEGTNGDDNGPGSLRQTIADAQAGDTITFAPEVIPNPDNGFV